MTCHLFKLTIMVKMKKKR
uniref:Uncharacterized protein n=1 Tax=Arundo donax TaxID=35708 RepID=A0A0A9C9N1_ARUDO